MPDWPDHVKFDVTFQAYMKRVEDLEQVLTELGGFDSDVAFWALLGNRAKAEEVARWAREDLKDLRENEKVEGKARAYSGGIPRIVISDVAMTMLEAITDQGEVPGDELLSLMGELLNVDRHRTHKSKKRGDDWEAAAAFDGAGPGDYPVRALGRAIGRDHKVISDWRADPEYQRKVEYRRSGKWAEALEFLGVEIDENGQPMRDENGKYRFKSKPE